ncbi:MAG: homocysteine S-methyltransferase family protein [Streptosporangiales bacterium]|nr:homocysteine S-methyltransferase family protein [Streptosporangiales bacterium]
MFLVSDPKPGLLERLDAGGAVCAEGYLFECERRGYVQAGAFVPEVVLDHPEAVSSLHREFVHAGSDIVEAFTYYGHREKLRLVGKEDILEPLNRNALAIARAVAEESGTLLAGNLCNTNLWADENARPTVRSMFAEQVGWAVEEGAELLIGETFSYLDEALLCVEMMRESGLPTVITLVFHREDVTRDGYPAADAAKALEQAGADVVGVNCGRGPATTLPLLRTITDAVSCHVAALPVPYRTTPSQPTMQALTDPLLPEQRPFPTALDPFTCTRYEMGDFASQAYEMGVRYLGVCCGAGPHHIRAVAEAMDRWTPASVYTPDMSKHAYLGTDPTLKAGNQQYASLL